MWRFFWVLLLAFAVTCQSQTYYIYGLHRQGNAEDARAYLKIKNEGLVTNWFTTNIAGSSIPLYLIVGVTSNQIEANTWYEMTNMIRYDNSDTTLLPGVIDTPHIGTNLWTILTNNRSALTTFSNTVEIKRLSAAAALLDFTAPSANGGVIAYGGSSYIRVGTGAEVAFFKDAVSQSDGTYSLGRSPTAMRWHRAYLKGGLYISSNSFLNLPTLTYGDNFYMSSNGVPHVIWVDHLGTETTTRLVP